MFQHHVSPCEINAASVTDPFKGTVLNPGERLLILELIRQSNTLPLCFRSNCGARAPPVVDCLE